MCAKPTLKVLSSEKDISTPWLEELLKQSLKSDIEVTNWTSRVPDKRSGFLSEFCFVRVTFQGPKHPSEERSLAIKFAPRDERVLDFVKEGNLARKESEFYKFVTTDEFQNFCQQSGITNPVPQVYWSEMEGDAVTLVMHDLGPDGFRIDMPSEGSSLQQIQTAMKSIAVIHACGVAAVRKHGKAFFDVTEGDFVDGYLRAGLDIELDLFKGTPTEKTIRALYDVREALIKARPPFFETLIHGDFWAGNIMFSSDNKSAVVIDWQFATIDNPVCDIVCLLLISAHPDVYEKHLNDVLTTYWHSLHEALQRNGESLDKTFQELVDTVEEMWTFSFMFFTASLPDLLNIVLTVERTKNIVLFLENKGVFSRFLQRYGKGNS